MSRCSLDSGSGHWLVMMTIKSWIMGTTFLTWIKRFSNSEHMWLTNKCLFFYLLTWLTFAFLFITSIAILLSLSLSVTQIFVCMQSVSSSCIFPPPSISLCSLHRPGPGKNRGVLREESLQDERIGCFWANPHTLSLSLPPALSVSS